MRRCTLILALTGCFVIGESIVPPDLSSSGVFAQQAVELNADTVKRKIDQGVRFLLDGQYTGGRWSVNADHPGGITALCTLALLNCGVEHSHLAIQRSLRYLDSLDLQSNRKVSVYTVSLMTMVYCQVGPDTLRARIRECVDYLDEAQLKSGPHRGGWSYYRSRGNPDGSNSQFALLALHEAGRIGVTADQSVWDNARFYWEGMRNNFGGFFYRKTDSNRTGTGSMTCAAISSLIIIDENLNRPLPDKDRVVCCQGNEQLDLVDGAIDWMSQQFKIKLNPTDGYSQFLRNRYYYLYGMERAGRLAGIRFFGQHDWYRAGAEVLVSTQSAGGSWTGTGHGESDPNVATAFALLFLSKGKRPVVIGKYKHSIDNDWDRHRTGVHYLTRAIERDWGAQLNWQTIEGRAASTDDLREAEVLFFSGRDSLRLSDQQKQRLRDYIEMGGFVFAEACQGDGCGENVGFDQDFRHLMSELFPNSQLQLLDPAHPVFKSLYELTPNPDRPLYGLQSSCRTTVIYCPTNLSGFWRMNRPSYLSQLTLIPRRDVDYVTKLGINVVSYATGREVKDKLDRISVSDAVDDGAGERALTIPKLSHGGGADDAPNAWQNVIRQARFELKQRFKVERRMIAAELDQLANYPMVFMHGRTRFSWNEDERDALRRYLENGGLLCADSICSSGGFVEAFRQEIAKVFPDTTLQRIPADHSIWSMKHGGYPLDSVAMHQTANVPGGVRRFRTPPLLEGIFIDDRLAVVFSPHDLSCAMENATAAQCDGYDKDDAARIGVNVILYALNP